MTKTAPYCFWKQENASIHSVFADVAIRYPATTAIEDDDIRLTYEELDDLSSRLAGYLQVLGVEGGSPVAILLDKGCDYLLSCIAILKLGSPYLHLEIGYPEDFLQETLLEASPAALITTTQFASRLGGHSQPVITLDTDAAWQNHRLDIRAAHQVDAQSPAFIGFSSGTTGKPKGMLVSHRAMLYAFAKFWEEVDQVSENHRFGYITYMSWDALSPLMVGKTGIILSNDSTQDFVYLVNELCKKAVNHVFFTPSMLKRIVEEVPVAILRAKLAKLRIIWLGGEVVTQRLVNLISDLLPDVILLNNYGPSECFVVSQGVLKRANDGDDAVCHAGKILPEMHALLLDENMRQVEPGETGFLYVSGPCLADGYLNQPELTREKFQLFDDQIYYATGDIATLKQDAYLVIHGRDNFIQKYGKDYHAVSKCERTIKSLPAVSDCILINYKSGAGKASTAAFIVMADRKALGIDIHQVIQDVRSHLTDDLVPARIIPVPSIPIHPVSRKADYSTLLSLL